MRLGMKVFFFYFKFLVSDYECYEAKSKDISYIIAMSETVTSLL